MSAGRLGVRIAAVLAVVAALAVVAFLFLFQGAPYTVKVQFENASQIVPGNIVSIAGSPVGVVEQIKLTDDGQAELELALKEKKYTPLRRGTQAIVRQASLSGVANRYVDLMLPTGKSPEIESGGLIESQETQAAVDLDQLFNTFDPVARTAVQRDFAGFAEMYAGRTEEANEAFKLFNPALASASSLFEEINRDTPDLERFIVQTAGLVNTVASRDDDLAGLIDNLATTAEALANERDGLSETIERLPDFMRKSNTTFVNLRGTLDDLDPLVEESRPALRRLRPFLAQLRPFAREAVPTVRDFSRTVRTPGRDNDLIEFLQAQPAVDRIANQTVQANGKQRDGAFPETARSLAGSTPQFAFFRPYVPDLYGWFDDFSTTGQNDALGNFSRSGLAFNAFTLGPTATTLLPVPPPLRDQILTTAADPNNALRLGEESNNPCPGSSEIPKSGDNPFKPSPDFNCDADEVAVGP